MKAFVFLLVFFCSCTLCAQILSAPDSDTENQDGPPDARAGLCYTKLINSDGTSRWKGILCEWKEWGSISVVKDKLEPSVTNYAGHYINKRLKPLIQRGLPIEIRSYYASKASETTDACLARARAMEVGEYLIQEGLERRRLKITVEPATDKDTMWMHYRVIDEVPRKRKSFN